MKRFVLEQPHFIGGALLATGSIVTEAELNGAKPGEFLVEVDAHGQPKKKADRDAGISGVAEDVQIAPVAPHAPNPTAPQGLPPHGVNEVAPAGSYVGAEGVESNEAADARAAQSAKKAK